MEDLWSTLAQLLVRVLQALGGTQSRVSPLYLAPFVLIAWVIYRRRASSRGDVGFWSWLFPRAIYRDPSTLTDVKLFVLNQVLRAGGLISQGFFGFMTYWGVQSALQAAFGEGTGLGLSATGLGLVALTVVHAVAMDFALYWSHRWGHTVRYLWPLHSVHHSADVLSPVTVYRAHPVDNIFNALIGGVVMGTVAATLRFALFEETTLIQYGGINAVLMIYYFFYANFRHSHIWISFPNALEHVLMSPAQHQVHHSINPKHHHKNFGGFLAIWDWMFGSLCLSRDVGEISLGLSDEQGRKLPQPHPDMKTALVAPLGESWRAIKSFRPVR